MADATHQLVMASLRKHADAIRSDPHPALSFAPVASPRIQSMIKRRSEFENDLEFEIEASKDHWSELESKITVNQAEAHMDTLSKIVTKQQHFQILGHFCMKLGALFFCCKCPNCLVFKSSPQQQGNQVESLSILGRFRRRLGRLFLCWQCSYCGILNFSPQHQGNQLECIELEEPSESEDETNREIFASIKKQWGGFFSEKWGNNLELGNKIAEGGQAEIFEVEGGIDSVLRMEFVVKAFKKGYSLRSLQIQWPLGMLQNTSPEGHFNSAKSAIIFAGTVLRDDRFAFVMHKYWGDLRKLIDLKMQQRNSHGPPFEEHQEISIMLQIANGMEQLHKKKIPHRDLKASNILIALDITKRNPPDPLHATEYSCVIADYECSVGVVGTGFWRAPEVLVAVRDQTLNPSTFTAKADVYSFAMTSYEILTGCVPFEELAANDYDAVVRGRRPQLPHPMNSRLTELLCRCWHSNPAERPSFEEIGLVLESMQRSAVTSDSSRDSSTKSRGP